MAGTSEDAEGHTVPEPAEVDSDAGSVIAALRAAVDVERYRFGSVIGRGGMGEVRSAVDEWIGREVAIKILAPADQVSAEAASRFVREARVQGLLDHPAIVPVHDLGIDQLGRPYFVMKRLAGITLSDVLKQHNAGDAVMKERFPRRTLLARFADVCLAIEFAHTRGVVHRDLKPTNIMVGDFGETWVLDWGVAKLAADAPEVCAVAVDAIGVPDTPDSGDTAAGTVLGTPGYVAPEQIAADTPYDHRVDIYALGCVLFEILAGEPLHPRGRAALVSTLRGVDARPSARRADADVSPELDEVCVRATALDPARRYQTVRELYSAVQRYLDGDRDVERRQQLATDHAEAARDALEAGDRAAAMREAGRALALDPTETDALGIVTRLMLEPPPEMPRDAEADLRRAMVRGAKAQERAVAISNVGFALFVPALFWLGLRDLTWLATLIGGLGVMGTVSFLAARVPELSTRALWSSAIGNAFLIMMTSRLLGPYGLPAMLAPATAMAFVMHPGLRRPWLLSAVFVAAVGLPYGLEKLGWLSPTSWFTGDGLVLRSTVTDMPPFATEVVLTVFCLCHVVMASGFAIVLTRDQRAAQRKLHLQAWHLRQLVPAARVRTSTLMRTGDSLGP